MRSTEESAIYYFRLSKDVKEDVEVRLHSENGHFDVYLGKDFIPDATNYTKKADDHDALIFKQNITNSSDLMTYYIRVVPKQFSISTDN